MGALCYHGVVTIHTHVIERVDLRSNHIEGQRSSESESDSGEFFITHSLWSSIW